MPAEILSSTMFRGFFHIISPTPTPGEFDDCEVPIDIEASDMDGAANNALKTFLGDVLGTMGPPKPCGVRVTKIISMDGDPQVRLFLSPEEAAQIKMCRVCGCTEQDCSQCVERSGDACSWIEEDLCSVCQELGRS